MSSLPQNIQLFQFFDPGSRIFGVLASCLSLLNKELSIWYYFKNQVYNNSKIGTSRYQKFIIPLDQKKIEINFECHEAGKKTLATFAQEQWINETSVSLPVKITYLEKLEDPHETASMKIGT